MWGRSKNVYLSCLNAEVALQRFSVRRLRSSSASALTSVTMEKSNIDQGGLFLDTMQLKGRFLLGLIISKSVLMTKDLYAIHIYQVNIGKHFLYLPTVCSTKDILYLWVINDYTATLNAGPGAGSRGACGSVCPHSNCDLHKSRSAVDGATDHYHIHLPFCDQTWNRRNSSQEEWGQSEKHRQKGKSRAGRLLTARSPTVDCWMTFCSQLSVVDLDSIRCSFSLRAALWHDA